MGFFNWLTSHLTVQNGENQPAVRIEILKYFRPHLQHQMALR